MGTPILFDMAERTGLEPATPGVTGRYSNQLNYRSIFYLFDFIPEKCIVEYFFLVGAAGIEPATLAL